MSFTKVPTHQHRKKKYVFKERESPFPVPIASITRETSSKNLWYHYAGQIQGDFVLVTHSGDISYLNRMGFFGNGLMSRGEPSVYKDLPVVHLPSAKDSEPDVVRVMRRRMYLKHMKWKKSQDLRMTDKKDGENKDNLSVASEDQEFDSDQDCYQSDFVHEEDIEPNKLNPETIHRTNKVPMTEEFQNDIPKHKNIDKNWSFTSASQNSSVWSWNEEIVKLKPPSDSWDNTTSNEKSAAESWDMMEADEDFWASEDVSSETSRPKDNRPSDSDNTESKGRIKEKRDPCDIEDSSLSPLKKVKLCHESDISGKTDEGTYVEYHSFEISNVNTDNKIENVCKAGESDSVIDKVETEYVDKSSKIPEGDINDMLERTEEKMQISEAQEGYSDKVSLSNTDEVEKECNSQNNKGNMDRDFHESLPINPYCKSDDEDTNDDTTAACESCEYLVIDDSDIDDSTDPASRKEKYTWRPVRKKEIFNLNEPLVLSFEEAYFLCYGLGCLTVMDENQTSLTLTDLWCRFCQKPQFLPRYVAYHYFRSKGWVPKPSILFGTDFLVYKVGPVFYHASYSVIVKTVYADTYEEVDGYNMKFTWTSFFGLNRITEHVAKTLVYCYVIMPRELTEEEERSPECISRFKIRLQTVQRWVSSQDREKDKVIEDIT